MDEYKIKIITVIDNNRVSYDFEIYHGDEFYAEDQCFITTLDAIIVAVDLLEEGPKTITIYTEE